MQDAIKTRAEKEISNFLNSEVKIEKLYIYPFNELRITGLSVFDQKHKKCLYVDILGAGINLWKLIYDQEWVITYAEIIGLNGHITQQSPDTPLNIDFIIKAFAPKDKNKPPTQFDLMLHNIVIRKSALSFDRIWLPKKTDHSTDFNHISIYDLKADISIPRLKNDIYDFDIRRLAFKEKGGLDLEKLSLRCMVTPQSIDLSNLLIRLPESEITPENISLNFKSFNDISEVLKKGHHTFIIKNNTVVPSDFAFLYSPLANFNRPLNLTIDITGNLNDLTINELNIKQNNEKLDLSLIAHITDLGSVRQGNGNIELTKLMLGVESEEICRVLSLFLPEGLPEKFRNIITEAEVVKVKMSGDADFSKATSKIVAEVSSGVGNIDCKLHSKWVKQESMAPDFSHLLADYQIEINDLQGGAVAGLKDLGKTSISAEGKAVITGKNLEGTLNADIREINYKKLSFNDITIEAQKEGKNISGSIESYNSGLDLSGKISAIIDKDNSEWIFDADIRNIHPSNFISVNRNYGEFDIKGTLRGRLRGNNLDNLSGETSFSELSYGNKDKKFTLDNVILRGEFNDSLRKYSIVSPLIEGNITGDFLPSAIIPQIKNDLAEILPGIIIPTERNKGGFGKASYNFTINPGTGFFNFFNIPVKPLDFVTFEGYADLGEGKNSLVLQAPYLLQGKSKIIRDSRIEVLTESYDRSGALYITTIMPIKNDELKLAFNAGIMSGKIIADMGWESVLNKKADGKISLGAEISKNKLTGKPDVNLEFHPSSFRLNGAEWKIDNTSLDYNGDRLKVDNLKIWHNDQFLKINGTASAAADDSIDVGLAGIDLQYIFDTLNINYVTFGGIATGEIKASQLFSKMPIARTNGLFVKDLSYNNAILGDAELESHWDQNQGLVAINADIKGENSSAIARGGVYVTRDSLSFDIKADHVNIAFLKPFMEAFTSDVGGMASGDIKLYGTFKDIDLRGKAFADSISMKVDYTNVYYHGSDSVIIDPGHIRIPDFKLYDKYGNSAILKGFVKHQCFHNPEFEFNIREADNLLCYDTNPQLNPDWYGRIFASGGGTLTGKPGIVAMIMDMTTSPNSEFTFVLSETQTAGDYSFLTFSDKRKEAMEIKGEETLVDRVKNYYKTETTPSKPTVFAMDLRATVTPAAKLTIVMDPRAGDKITARGSGPMQISYNTESDEMQLYGKYSLAEGNYNFSLQDLILRDFKINPESSISFNGDPLRGMLDITAAYRVNTNLSDLDKSFSTDRELNRTNVPVDALLKVTGDMQQPEISFDISLPTLTQDVERKVKSIISTDDMMNRQIIYLLALNRFYTPEYMSTTNNGGELASVASSTISSQLSNIMGQLTDKVTVAPSFRSDKGDFSDMEVDLALSSRLLDNRLLINGNFGYRDRNTSQTTFVGDFDIEYLLTRSGDLRLKAYNHFNDQNYYLKSALTTQGIGMVYRKDFDNPFTFLKRRKKKSNKQSEASVDSLIKNNSSESNDKNFE